MSSNRCEESGSGAAPGERRLLVFRLADLIFAFDLENILEVADFSEIIHVPGAPPCLDGITSFKGETVPVLDLRCRLKIRLRPPIPGRNPEILVGTPDGKHGMAVPVDEVIGARELRNLDKASVKAVPPEIDPDFIAGIFRSGETDILEIRTAALLKE